MELATGDSQTAGASGNISISTGSAVGGNGGDITMKVGDGNTGAGGDMSLTAGKTTSSNATGGKLTMAGAAPDDPSHLRLSTSTGGEIEIVAGLGSGTGGAVTITTGVGTATDSGVMTLSTAAGGTSGNSATCP